MQVAQEIVAKERLKGSNAPESWAEVRSVLAFLSALEVTLYSSLKGLHQLSRRKPFNLLSDIHTGYRISKAGWTYVQLFAVLADHICLRLL